MFAHHPATSPRTDRYASQSRHPVTSPTRLEVVSPARTVIPEDVSHTTSALPSPVTSPTATAVGLAPPAG
jgi:hypothetical protein